MNDPNKSIFPGVEIEGTSRAELWGEGCGCWTCVGERLAAQHRIDMPFIVCPGCGNKRCPKATHHDNACTDSNDVGQVGSRYA